MRLRAKVSKVLHASTNYLGTIVGGKPVPVERLPDPAWLEISEEDGGVFLLYLNADRKCFADTWHQTVASAQREAMLGFGIKPEDWEEI
jgi:hypothetical protein